MAETNSRTCSLCQNHSFVQFIGEWHLAAGLLKLTSTEMAATKSRERQNHRRNRIEALYFVNISLCQQLGSVLLIRQCRPKASTISSRFHIIVECQKVTFDQEARKYLTFLKYVTHFG